MDQKIMQRVNEMFGKANISLDPETKAFLELTGLNNVSTNPGWATATASIFSSRINERALREHAAAIIKSAEASEKHASSLSRATWVLAIATIALVTATIALVITTFILAPK